MDKLDGCVIRDIRAGRIPSVDRIEALFDYLGLEAYFGLPRPAAQGSGTIAANHQPEEDAPSGFLTIPWAEIGTRPGSAPVAFSRSWLEANGLVPDFLVAALPQEVRLDGAPNGDTVALLDTRTSLRKGHGIWCYRTRAGSMVSRVTFAKSVIVIHAARPDDAPTVIEGPPGNSITLLGKVVWLGQSVPLKGKIE